MRKLIKFIKTMSLWVKYLLLYFACNAAVSPIYDFLREYSKAHRASDAIGGEALVWLIPFMVIYAVDTYRLSKKKRGGKYAKDTY